MIKLLIGYGYGWHQGDPAVNSLAPSGGDFDGSFRSQIGIPA
jgi:hypothetical protein